MAAISITQRDSADSALNSTGPDSGTLTSLIEAAASRVVLPDGEAAGVDRESLALVSELLVSGPAAFNVHAHEAGRIAQLRDLLDALCAEALRGPEAELLSGPQYVESVEAFARARRALTAREEVDFESLLDPDGSDLVVELAHDLRSPLTSILFLSETLRRGQSGEINEYQRRQLGIIYSAALGLISMASDVIELARGGEQLLERKPTAFSVGEILDSVCDMVQPLAEENSNTIRLLPPEADQRRGYPVALSRVLLNLTTNALKFTEQSFVELVAKETGRNTVEFSVRDGGRGMDEEEMANLFRPFHRVRSSNRYGFSGSGLGLSICRNLVRAMGSELHYESTLGWGTRFHFEVDLPPVSPV